MEACVIFLEWGDVLFEDMSFYDSFHVLAELDFEELGELGICYPRCTLEEVRPL